MEEKLTEDRTPKSSFQVLTDHFIKNRIVTPQKDENPEAAVAKFLQQGNNVNFPNKVRISVEGEPQEKWVPYRIWANPALDCLGASIKFLEYTIRRRSVKAPKEDFQGFNPYNDPKILEGVSQLCNLLIPACLTSTHNLSHKNRKHPTQAYPGGILLHRASPNNPEKPVLTKRAKLLKNAINRWIKYESTVRVLNGKNPTEDRSFQEILEVQLLFQKELENSFIQFQTLQKEDLYGTALLDRSNAGGSLQDDEEMDLSEDYPNLEAFEKAKDHQEQNDWYSEFEENVFGEDQKRVLRSNIPCEPHGWIWNHPQEPLEYICQYVSENIVPKLNEKREGVFLAIRQGHLEKDKKNDLLFYDPTRTSNPKDWWKVYQKISDQDPIQEEDPKTLELLASARFAVCLEETNHTFQISHNQFLAQWEKTVEDHLAGKTPFPSRNHALQATLEALPQCKEWTKKEKDQWIEHLQTLTIGGYDTSLSQEKNRGEILTLLNNTFKSISLLLKDRTEKGLDPKKVEQASLTLERVAEGIVDALTGPTGQTVRKEIRHHLQTKKVEALEKNQKEDAQNYTEAINWLASTSSKVKSGEWFDPKEQQISKDTMHGILIGLLTKSVQEDKEVVFEMSPTPKPRDPLSLNLDFLKGISKDNTQNGFAGRHTIETYIDKSKSQIDSLREKNIGTSIPTSFWKQNPKGQSIETKLRSAEEAQKIVEKVHASENPVGTLFEMTKENLETLAQDPSKDTHEKTSQAMAFFQGILYLNENIRMRREDPHYRISPEGRGIIKSCENVAREKLQSDSIVPTKVRESLGQKSKQSLLLTNAIAPVALWIQKPTKGKTNIITHEEFADSLQQKKEELTQIKTLLEKTTPEEISKQTQKEDIITYALNLEVYSQATNFIEDPEKLANALTWQHRNIERAVTLWNKNPENDSPITRFEAATSKPKTKTLTTTKQKEELAPS